MDERIVCIDLNEEFQLTTLELLNTDTEISDTEISSTTMAGARSTRKRSKKGEEQDGTGRGGKSLPPKKRSSEEMVRRVRPPPPRATQSEDENSSVDEVMDDVCHGRKRRDDYSIEGGNDFGYDNSEEEDSEDEDSKDEDPIVTLEPYKKKKSAVAGAVAGVPRNVTTSSSPAHDISLLSEFSKYKVQITPEMEKRIKQLELAQQEMALVKTEVNELKMKIKDYECQIAIYEMTKGSKKKRDKKDMDPASQQMLMEAKAIFCSKIGRVVKFPGPGWKLYSEEDKTICGMMLPHINFPSDSTSAQKTVLWNEVVVPELGRILSDHKNKITQLMRKQHDGELTIDDDNAGVNMHLTISLQCS